MRGGGGVLVHKHKFLLPKVIFRHFFLKPGKISPMRGWREGSLCYKYNSNATQAHGGRETAVLQNFFIHRNLLLVDAN